MQSYKKYLLLHNDVKFFFVIWPFFVRRYDFNVLMVVIFVGKSMWYVDKKKKKRWSEMLKWFMNVDKTIFGFCGAEWWAWGVLGGGLWGWRGRFYVFYDNSWRFSSKKLPNKCIIIGRFLYEKRQFWEEKTCFFSSKTLIIVCWFYGFSPNHLTITALQKRVIFALFCSAGHLGW